MSLISKWSHGLRLKLLIVSILPMFGITIISYVGITTAIKLNSEIDKAYQVRAKLIEYSGDMETAVAETVRMAWTSLNLEEPKEIASAVEKTKFQMDRFEKNMIDYLKIPRSPKMIEMFAPIDKAWPEAKIELQTLNALIEKNPSLAKTEGPQHIIKKIRPHLNKITEVINEMQDARREIMDKEVIELSKETHFAITLLILISIICSIATLTLGLTLASKTANDLYLLSNTLSASSDQVRSAANQIASTSEELSQATNEQAASMEQTATSLEQMSSMVNKNTENAKNTASTSTLSQEKGQEGKEAMERMMQAMQDINHSNESIMQQIDHSNQQMSEIVKVIQDIGAKTKVINEIVFQTKLLSFNASVEAARAGEHGKGFAVVAEEVGNLAQMSGNAAKEISAMLDGSMQKVENIIKDTKSGVENLIQAGRAKVEFGTDVANQCNTILNEIVNNVSQVSNMAKEISQASEEQSKGISEINKAMGQLDTVTQQNSATSEEAASAAEELSVQAESLKAAVGQLVQLIDGNNISSVNSNTFDDQMNTNVVPIEHAKKKNLSTNKQFNKTKNRIAS